MEAWAHQDNKKQISASQPSAGPFHRQVEGAQEEEVGKEIKVLTRTGNL